MNFQKVFSIEPCLNHQGRCLCSVMYREATSNNGQRVATTDLYLIPLRYFVLMDILWLSQYAYKWRNN